MTVSPEISGIIRSKAITEWPDDFEMQRHIIEQQTAAAEEMIVYQTKLDQTNPIIENCMRKAVLEWPDDFEMQVHVFQNQMEAAPNFFEYTHTKMPEETLAQLKEKAFSEWPEDYEMMLHVLLEQVSAWEELYG